MSNEPEARITLLLQQAAGGDAESNERLFELVYDELHRQARRQMLGQPLGHTLQATAIVHEAYMRIAKREGFHWESRGHFLATAARAMRCVLVDHARGKQRHKRGGGDLERRPLDGVVVAYEENAVDLIALDTALEQLAERDAQAARIVELRFFGGHTVQEAAELLGISEATAKRDWVAARTWLRKVLA